jgi:hypothetical protein
LSLLIVKPTVNQFGKDQHESPNINIESDSLAILNILDKFHVWMKDKNISDDISVIDPKHISDLFNVEKYGLTKNEIEMLFKPQKMHSPELNDKISSHKKSTYIDILENELSKIQLYKLGLNKESLEKWCDTNNVNIKTIIEYISSYAKLRNAVSKNMTLEISSVIESIAKSYKNAHILIERNINTTDLALLFGFPFNVCKKMGKSTYYLSLYNPNFDNIYTIKSLSKYKYKPNSLINPLYFQEYILYLSLISNSETDENALTCIHKIEPQLFSILAHIYSDTVIKKITGHVNVIPEIEYVISKKIEGVKENTNLANAIINYTKTLNKYEIDITNCKDLKIIEFIKGLDENLTNIEC